MQTYPGIMARKPRGGNFDTDSFKLVYTGKKVMWFMAGTNLPYKPGIFKQGLALVLIPLSVGTCVLLFLNQLWLSAEKVAHAESQQSQVVEELTDILVSWSILSASTIVRAVEKDWDEIVKKEHPWLWFNFYKLKQTTRDHPEALARVLRLEEISHNEIEACATLPHGGDGLTLELARQLPKTLGKIYQMRTEVKRMLVVEQVELEQVREKQKRSFESMKLYAYGFAAANVGLALSLVFLFSRSIGTRIKILAENAAALPRAPKRHLQGDDELAYLDRALSKTAVSLQNAAEHRRSILGMVAHDMRSPLMSSQVSIQIVEEIGGEYSDDAFASLEAAGKQLASILTFVQDLLTVQKAEDENVADSEPDKKPLAENSLTDSASTNTSVVSASALTPITVTPELKSFADSPLISAAGATGGALDFLTRPKIFHKGLLVTLTPLVMQIAFLLFINNQLTSTENLAKGEQRCSDIKISSSLIKMDMTRGASTRGIYLITSSTTAERVANKIFAEIEKEYGRLSSIVGNDKEWQRYIKLAESCTQHQIERMMKLSPSAEAMDKWAAFEDISELKQRSPEAYESRQLGNALLKANVESLHEMEAQQRKLADLISKIIGVGIFANFAIALCMLYFFSKNIIDRIKVLAANAAKIASGEQLTPIASGTDELAYLGLILHQAKAELDLASQQRALMMASLAQQMRVPLQTAKIHLEKFNVAAAQDIEDNVKKHLLRAEKNIDRVINLVDDLLTMESLESGKVTLEISECDIRLIADEALSTVSSLAKKKSISTVNECSSIKVNADKARLVQVLINYLSNAIKFSPENTQITLSMQSTPEKIRVNVIDQGPGMDAETRDRVFEKFFQANTQEKKQGFGLGLAICQLIVSSHNGRLGVDSEPGKGSNFWFEIPS